MILAVDVDHLTYVYATGLRALHEVSLEVSVGSFVAIIGHNGSGKTTLIKHFNALLKPTSGVVRVLGASTDDATVASMARKVGFLFQNPDDQLFLDSVRKEIEFGPRNVGMTESEIESQVDRLAAHLELTGYLDAHPFRLSRLLRRKVAIASALSTNPDILVLDEPTAGQDLGQTNLIMQVAGDFVRGGGTAIMVTHDLSLVARHCSFAYLLHEGRLLAVGQPVKLLQRASKLGARGFVMPQVIDLSAALGYDPPPCTPEALVERVGSELSARDRPPAVADR